MCPPGVFRSSELAIELTAEQTPSRARALGDASPRLLGQTPRFGLRNQITALSTVCLVFQNFFRAREELPDRLTQNEGRKRVCWGGFVVDYH